MRWCASSGWIGDVLPDASLLLAFGGNGKANVGDALASLRANHPHARLLGCSTAGEISNGQISDAGLSVLALQFDATPVTIGQVEIEQFDGSRAAGDALARQLPRDGLRHVFLLSDGLGVNGSELALGMEAALPDGVPVTGGLAGDDDRFERTQVFCDDFVGPGRIVCAGFYGDRVATGYGSLGGWDVFGPERIISRAEDNVLFELDGQSALTLYKEYLGKHAEGLPGSGLLFPLQIQTPKEGERVVRTILGVDEDRQCLIFAGDMPQGARAQLMKASIDRLIDGATGAATICSEQAEPEVPWGCALLVSCVGRRIVLQQRTAEELAGARTVLGADLPMAGFYSYGELAPFLRGDSCRLHNQTMTITTLAER